MTTMAIRVRRTLLRSSAASLMLAVPAFVVAQAPATGGTLGRPLRVTAMTGGFAPRDAVIVDPQGADTRLGAAPAIALDLQYEMANRFSLYATAAAAFGTLHHGSNLASSVRGATSDAMMLAGTGGVLYEFSSGVLRPTLRGGGGVKYYNLGTTGASNFAAPTADIGLGFRAGTGPIEVSAELRYLPSTFDQAKLPMRGLVGQKQRQTDILFGVGITVRP
ncbi:MAG: hypothetical protein ACT4P7_09095 [Gemmatimonadaceae bacterium]